MAHTVDLDQEEITRVLNDNTFDANFADRFVGDKAVRKISNTLAFNATKTRLFLDRNCVGANGAASLGELLKVNKSILLLSLEWNSIGTNEEGIRVLADGLGLNDCLTKLILCNNRISAQGATSIAQALRTNCTLTELDLRWNNVGNNGARALRDSLDVNRALTSLKLAGNKVDDFILDNLDAVLRNRDSDALARTAVLDDLHLSQGKAEKLEARLRQQATEEAERACLAQERETKLKQDTDEMRDESARSRLDFERQLSASAEQVAELEEQLIHEQSRTVDLKTRLEKEGERRTATLDELEKTKQRLAEAKREASRQVERLQEALDSANEVTESLMLFLTEDHDRGVIQGEFAHARDMLEREAQGFKNELRAAHSTIEKTRRDYARASAEAQQAAALLETARAEVRLTGERAEEALLGVTRATREGKTALEDTRRMYEERMEATRADFVTRVHAAEERARTADLERQRAEVSRQAAHKELTQLQVSTEERVSQTESRVLAETQKQFDSELAELRERIEAVHKSRDSKVAQAQEHLASLEELRARSSLELREFTRELSNSNEELEKARTTARSHEAKAQSLQMDIDVLKRTVGGLQQRVEEAQRDKKRANEMHSANTDKMHARHALELREAEQRLTQSRAELDAAEDRAKTAEGQVSAMRREHSQSLHVLERSVGKALAEAVACAQQKLGEDVE